jgi:PadR family transcriptional regulator PadR
MGDKTDVWQGTLALMVLRTLETMGAQHGYGLARRIEQTSGDLLQLNYGTLYPALLKLEQEGFIRSQLGQSLKTIARQNFTSSPRPAIAR